MPANNFSFSSSSFVVMKKLLLIIVVLAAFVYANDSNESSKYSSERSNDILKKPSGGAQEQRSILGSLLDGGKTLWNVIPSPTQVFSYSFKTLFALPQSAVTYALDTICMFNSHTWKHTALNFDFLF